MIYKYIVNRNIRIVKFKFRRYSNGIRFIIEMQIKIDDQQRVIHFDEYSFGIVCNCHLKSFWFYYQIWKAAQINNISHPISKILVQSINAVVTKIEKNTESTMSKWGKWIPRNVSMQLKHFEIHSFLRIHIRFDFFFSTVKTKRKQIIRSRYFFGYFIYRYVKRNRHFAYTIKQI